ncbi:glycosyltransferase [Methanobacterium sp.]|uniref:glycosyltransferase n=1 Tax=Methanobacterium sp. TaxID=2164 RepID=UPI003C70EBB3
MSILITIGIVAKNEEKYIEETLRGIINQDIDTSLIEIIVVDGNSSDRTREIAENVLNMSNVNYKVLNEKDFGFYGLCFSRNLVIDNSSSTSKYIAYTDADCIVDENWLKTLYQHIKGSGDEVAGAGGPRLVAPTKDKKELVINNFLTSNIASGGNPAFSKRNVKYLDSIPNYNSIYKKDIISKFRYDDSLIISDDNELNLRLKNAGYNFIYAGDAKIYHRETNSILEFGKNMRNYGINITNTIKKHRLFKIKPFISLIFLLYLILLIPLYLIVGWIIIIPLILYLLFAVTIFAEITSKTKTIYSLMVFLLLPVQHIAYAYGMLYNFLFVRPVHRNNK